jgi:hypothetical protein
VAKRLEALMGTDKKDVATGRVVGVKEAALIGPQKATIAEQLIRSEGYGVSSRIVNGMSRTVDALTVMGFREAVFLTRVEAVEGCSRNRITTRKGESLAKIAPRALG